MEAVDIIKDKSQNNDDDQEGEHRVNFSGKKK
jgi:hypothetical protein